MFQGAAMQSTTTGLYKSSTDALQAIQLLEEAGVAPADISFVASNEDLSSIGVSDETHSNAPGGFAIGAASGGTVGAILAGIGVAGSFATGGASLGLLVAGPIATTLMGAGAGAAAGSVIGGMIGAAIPDTDLKYYENAIKAGSVLLGVKTDDESRDKVKATLESSGAERVLSQELPA
jgi:hypothetical protein